MRRVLVLACLWIVGVAASVAVAFAAVGRVAERVAPESGGRLSTGAIEQALGSTPSSTGSGATRPPRTTSAPPSTIRPTVTTRGGPSGSSSTTVPASVATSTPPTSRPGSPPTTGPGSPPPTSPPPTTVAPHDTVTTSQGGTVWTRCSGSEHIVFVAAVPKNGYTRTYDVELPDRVEEWFDSAKHRSIITAECSDGHVEAEVEEQPLG